MNNFIINARAQLALYWSSLCACAVMLTGCQTSGYEQEAGARVNWPERSETGTAKDEPHGAHIRYEFGKNGDLSSIDVNITNATDMALIDESLLKSKSAVSKSSIGAAGSRNGMLDNNTKVEGKAETESKLAAALKELQGILKELKSPVALPTKD